jgi:hypothetical protein
MVFPRIATTLNLFVGRNLKLLYHRRVTIEKVPVKPTSRTRRQTPLFIAWVGVCAIANRVVTLDGHVDGGDGRVG